MNLGVALRAGLLRAPLPLGPAEAGLLGTLHIPNAGRSNIALSLAVLHCATASRSAPAAVLAAAWPAAKAPPGLAVPSIG